MVISSGSPPIAPSGGKPRLLQDRQVEGEVQVVVELGHRRELGHQQLEIARAVHELAEGQSAVVVGPGARIAQVDAEGAVELELVRLLGGRGAQQKQLGRDGLGQVEGQPQVDLLVGQRDGGTGGKDRRTRGDVEGVGVAHPEREPRIPGDLEQQRPFGHELETEGRQPEIEHAAEGLLEIDREGLAQGEVELDGVGDVEGEALGDVRVAGVRVGEDGTGLVARRHQHVVDGGPPAPIEIAQDHAEPRDLVEGVEQQRLDLAQRIEAREQLEEGPDLVDDEAPDVLDEGERARERIADERNHDLVEGGVERRLDARQRPVDAIHQDQRILDDGQDGGNREVACEAAGQDDLDGVVVAVEELAEVDVDLDVADVEARHLHREHRRRRAEDRLGPRCQIGEHEEAAQRVVLKLVEGDLAARIQVLEQQRDGEGVCRRGIAVAVEDHRPVANRGGERPHRHLEVERVAAQRRFEPHAAAHRAAVARERLGDEGRQHRCRAARVVEVDADRQIEDRPRLEDQVRGPVGIDEARHVPEIDVPERALGERREVEVERQRLAEGLHEAEVDQDSRDALIRVVVLELQHQVEEIRPETQGLLEVLLQRVESPARVRDHAVHRLGEALGDVEDVVHAPVHHREGRVEELEAGGAGERLDQVADLPERAGEILEGEVLEIRQGGEIGLEAEVGARDAVGERRDVVDPDVEGFARPAQSDARELHREVPEAERRLAGEARAADLVGPLEDVLEQIRDGEARPLGGIRIREGQHEHAVEAARRPRSRGGGELRESEGGGQVQAVEDQAGGAGGRHILDEELDLGAARAIGGIEIDPEHEAEVVARGQGELAGGVDARQRTQIRLERHGLGDAEQVREGDREGHLLRRRVVVEQVGRIQAQHRAEQRGEIVDTPEARRVRGPGRDPHREAQDGVGGLAHVAHQQLEALDAGLVDALDDQGVRRLHQQVHVVEHGVGAREQAIVEAGVPQQGV